MLEPLELSESSDTLPLVNLRDTGLDGVLFSFSALPLCDDFLPVDGAASSPEGIPSEEISLNKSNFPAIDSKDSSSQVEISCSRPTSLMVEIEDPLDNDDRGDPGGDSDVVSLGARGDPSWT